MKKNKQSILNALFLLFTFGVVLYIGFSGNSLKDLWHALQSLSPLYLLLCILCWCLNFVLDALSIHYFLRKQGYPLTFAQSLYISLTGIYYCNVTPGATGGQPMQIYRLQKYDVPIGVSGSGMTVRFFCFQTTLLVIGAGLWLALGGFVQEHLAGKQWLIVLGYVINFFSIGMVIIMAISRRPVHWITATIIRIGAKLRLCKHPDEALARWEQHLNSFHDSVKTSCQHPTELLVQCLIAAGQVLAQMGVIVMTYRAFGLHGTSVPQLLVLGVLLYISASYVPLPGASGAQEGGFALYFAGVFPDAQLFVALLIWRFCTYYLPVILGVVMTVCENIHGFSHKGAPDET